jgi:serine-type D-Ala-D-Ala carboxypeptidase (penicillin-binding protein 5/6)
VLTSTGRHRRRRVPAAIVLVVVCVAGAGIGLAVLLRAGGGSGRAAAPEPAAVERLTTPAPERPPVQAAVGPLPDPPGAARVDLTRPSLLPALRLHPSPAAGLAFDLADGSVLWRRGAMRVRPIASLTKLMTGLLAVERFGPHDRVRISALADRAGGTHMGGLFDGRRVRAESLLAGLMISSGNDAAVALAVAGAGSVRAWVQRMNRRAQLLGLTCTHYVDPSGLDPRNRSCPADLAALAARAIAEPRLRRIARRRVERVWPGGGKTITLRTTNHLLRERYPGAIGLKTGFTSAAGHCLVAIIERGSRKIGIVLLGSRRDAFEDARRIAREAARAGVMPGA